MELLQWYVRPGDVVRQFDRVCDVQSDKASVEITCRYDGVVTEVCGAVGDMMKVGSPLLYVDTAETAGGGAGAGAGGGAGRAEAAATDGGEVGVEAVTTATVLNNVDDEEDRLSIPSSVVAPPTYSGRTQAAMSGRVLTSPAVRRLGNFTL